MLPSDEEFALHEAGRRIKDTERFDFLLSLRKMYRAVLCKSGGEICDSAQFGEFRCVDRSLVRPPETLRQGSEKVWTFCRCTGTQDGVVDEVPVLSR